MRRPSEIIDRTLNTRISPLAYLYVLRAYVTGIAYTFLSSLSNGVQSSVLYKVEVILGHQFWGGMLLVGATFLLLGMWQKQKRPVQIGSSILFMSWAFAAITYAEHGYWPFLLPLAILEMLSWGYYYLSVSIGRLWNYTPESKR